jgi:hypothetical protein
MAVEMDIASASFHLSPLAGEVKGEKARER